MSNLKNITITGVFWNVISRVLTQVIQFSTTIVLARLLCPEDFGLVGMALIYVGLLMFVNEMGIVAPIIQKKDIRESHLSSCFWASLCIGIFVCLVSIVISPVIAKFFDKDRLKIVISALSIGFVFGSIGVVHKAQLCKELNFKKIATTEIIAAVCSGSISIILAINGFGVWSIVCGFIVHNVVLTSLLWTVLPWRPKWMFCFKSLRELLKFGLNVMGNNTVNYLRDNADFFIVGKYLGDYSLGIYSLAFNLVKLPVLRISSMVTRVLFPVFSKIQDDNQRVQQAYLKVISYISITTFPIVSMVFIIAPEFVFVVFGEKWADAVIPLRILCPIGAIISVGSTIGSVINAKGRPDIQFKWNSFYLVAFIVVLLLTIKFGLVGVSIGMLSLYIIGTPIIQYITNSLIELSFKKYLLALWPAVLGSICMSLVVFLLRWQISLVFKLDNIFFIIIMPLIGSIVYLSFLKLFRFAVVDELLIIIKDFFYPFLQRNILKGLKNN